MIHLSGIQKRFGALHVLRGIDLDTRRGRITALIGPNGSGKTTLARMILGLVHADEGTIHVADRPVSLAGAYREVIGYMPQIVRFPGNLTGHEIARLLSNLRTSRGEPDTSLVDAFRIEREMNRPLRTLSGGTRQKVNAALAFRFRPDLMILDEPTAGLDPLAGEIFRDKVLEERGRGRTFLITSHDMAHLEAVADDVAFLLDGRLVYDGTLEELMRSTGTGNLSSAIARLMRYPEAA